MIEIKHTFEMSGTVCAIGDPRRIGNIIYGTVVVFVPASVVEGQKWLDFLFPDQVNYTGERPSAYLFSINVILVGENKKFYKRLAEDELIAIDGLACKDSTGGIFATNEGRFLLGTYIRYIDECQDE